jgi:cytochrome P450
MVYDNMQNVDNWLAPSFFANPYETFSILREHDPVHWNNLFGFWIITRYDDVFAALQDARFTSTFAPFDAMLAALTPEDLQALGSVAIYISMFMQGMDPPLHTRQRALAHKSFTPRTIERMRTRTQEIVDKQLNEVERQGSFDLMRDLAFPLPSTVIFELLGVPLEGRELVRSSSETIATFVALVNPAPGQIQQMAVSLQDVADYLRPIIAARRERPQDDLLSLLVSTEEQGERLSEQEILIITTMLLFAGHETTTNLIGNGLIALLQHREQWQELKDDPALLNQAVEEMLRYDSSVHMVPRFLAEDVEFGGKHLHKGERVMLGLAASNRDPAHFSEPDRFDLHRAQERHLSFGYGRHFCLGAALARMEAQITIGSLLRRMPNLQLATDTFDWRPNIAMRGLKSLPLTF